MAKLSDAADYQNLYVTETALYGAILALLMLFRDNFKPSSFSVQQTLPRPRRWKSMMDESTTCYHQQSLINLDWSGGDSGL